MVDKIRRCPEDVVVAVLADIAGLEVIEGLAACVRPVVATDAAARDIGVIEVRRTPGNGGMTIVAGFCAGDVRLILP